MSVLSAEVPVENLEASICDEYDLIPITGRPGYAWWSGNDPVFGQWIPVRITDFMERHSSGIAEDPQGRV